MTEAEMKAALKPVMTAITDAARRGASDDACAELLDSRLAALPPAARTAAAALREQLPALIARGRAGRDRTGLGPDDAKDLHRYFSANDDGTFPGTLHRHFGMDVRSFSNATGLRLRVASDGNPSGWVSRAPGDEPDADEFDDEDEDEDNEPALTAAETDTLNHLLLRAAGIGAGAVRDEKLLHEIAKLADDPERFRELVASCE